MQQIRENLSLLSKKYPKISDADFAEQGSDTWFKMKLGVLSASNAHKIVAKKGTATRDGYIHELCAQIMTGEHESISGAALDWGKHLEDSARAAFEFKTGLELEEVPFVFKDDTFREGASPDALVIDKMGVEIKCPLNSANHIKSILDKPKSEWLWQTNYQMRILGVDEWMFCSFDPRCTKLQLHTMIIERDEKKQKAFDEAVPEFLHDLDKALETLGVHFGSQWE